eukprot:4681791-Prymnesium_polylepis.1
MPPAEAQGEVPLTHVHKWGCGWTKDCYSLGSWEDGDTSAPGVWTTSPSSTPGAQYEYGVSYAAKVRPSAARNVLRAPAVLCASLKHVPWHVASCRRTFGIPPTGVVSTGLGLRSTQTP